MLESALASGLAAAGADVFLGGRPADAGRGDPRPPARLRPRGGRLRLPQPLARQRDQVLRPRRPQARRREPRLGSRSASPPVRPPAPPRAGSASSRAPSTTTCASWRRRLRPRSLRPPDRPRLRQRRHLPRRAGRLRAARRRADHDRRRARRPQHQRGLRFDPPRERRRDRRRDGAEIGFAFDGDGDRMLAVDGEGREFDGDEIVALAAMHLREAGELPGGAAVTVMSNYGFHQAMEAAGIEVATTKVGDRYVIEELVERGWTIGGEQSGHIIWTDFAATGDGLAAALLVMRALGDQPLAECRPIEKLPQRLENVAVPSQRGAAGADRALGGGRPRGSRPRGPRPGARPPVRHRAAGPGHGRGTRRGRMRGGPRPACRGRPRRGASRTLGARPRGRQAGRRGRRDLAMRRAARILARPLQPPESSCAASSDTWAGGLVAISSSPASRSSSTADTTPPASPCSITAGSTPSAPSATWRTCAPPWRSLVTRAPSPSPRPMPRSASRTRAGRPTAGSPRRTPTRTATRRVRSTSSSTGSSRTTRSCAATSSPRATSSAPRPTPRSSPT